jgi:hypothetical protein
MDDSYLSTGSSNPTNPIAFAAANLKNPSPKWERSLNTTGEAINLQKSCWVLFAWKWNRKKTTLLSPTDYDRQLLMTAGYNTQSPIAVPQHTPYESYRTQGAYLSPSSKTSKAMQILSSIAIDYATKIQSSNFSKEPALWSYLLYFLQRSASLPTLTLSEQQYNTIQSLVLTAILPKSGLNHHTAHSIIHGPLLYSGLSLPHFIATRVLANFNVSLVTLEPQIKPANFFL